MKNLTQLVFFTVLSLTSLTGYAADGEKGKDKVWTRWELSTTADIYYRLEIVQIESAKTISVEF